MTKIKNKNFEKYVNELAIEYSEISEVLKLWGMPKYWHREPSFRSIILIIIEQQISTLAASTIFKNLEKNIYEVTADRVIALGIEGLRKQGLSRQKAFYCYNLAESVNNGDLVLSELNKDSDDIVFQKLIRFPGIGPWSASIYMLSAMERLDIWPPNDLGLIKGTKDLLNESNVNNYSKNGERWKPLRSIAARLIWHHYDNKLGTGISI